MSKYHFIYLLAGLLTFSACKEEEPLVVTQTASLSAVINGLNWTANKATMGATIIDGVTNISGITADDQVITITLNTTTPGTFPLSDGYSYVMAYLEDQNGNNPAYTSNAIASNIGRVVITEIDTKKSVMSGRFNGDVLRSIDNERIEITNGQFIDIPFTTEVVPVEEEEEEEEEVEVEEEEFFLKAEIDGNLWKAPSLTGSTLNDDLSIMAINASTYESITFSFPMSITKGNFQMGDLFTEYGAQYNMNQSNYLMAESGTLEITEHDTEKKELAGTFSFEAKEFGGGTKTASVQIGSFRVQY